MQHLLISLSYLSLSIPRTQMATTQGEDDRNEGSNPKRATWGDVGFTALSVGKKAAIAGAAVTSAPVLIPPAILLSAVGIAFAFPFGVFFAGVACTDKLMRSLLSRHESEAPQQLGFQGVEDEGDAVDVDGSVEGENLSSCYESALDDFSSDAENKGMDALVNANDEIMYVANPREGQYHGNHQGSYSERKIWEQLSAIRTIVGYEAPLRSSYVEELRALYVFTGVQPPLSSKDSSDHSEINEKLECLKSVVGIK